MDEPNIVKELREAERLGVIQSKMENSYEELQTKEEPYVEETSKLGLVNDVNEIYKIIFENSAVAIMLTNEKEEIISWNKYAERLLGKDKDELYLKPVSSLYPPEEWRKIRSENIRQKGMQHHLETKILKKNNELLDVDISLSVLKNSEGDVIGSIGIIRDITDRKEAEDQIKMVNKKLQISKNLLALLNKNLEGKVEERTKEVRDLLRKKDDFIHQLGHDLKTPLSPLTNLLPAIMEKEKDPGSKEMLKVSIKCVSYIKELVLKTLGLARLNSPNVEFNFEDIDLKSEIDNIVESIDVLLKDNDIEVENRINEEIVAQVDKLWFKELINNLFTNAIKYTPGKGKVIINAEKGRNKVIISIKDSGIGMTSEQIVHIFDEFYKADESRHALDSSGLGLAICKRIVERHGGRIWAESPGKDKGTIFYFTLRLENKD